MFHPKLLINFLSLSIVGQIDWHAFRIHRIDWSCCEAKQDLWVDHAQIVPSCYVIGASPHFCVNTYFGTPSGTTIIMVAHNNRDILIVPYEDLPDEDKDVIGKAIEEFQNKCLLSYTKTRDNTIVQKFPLPRVLLHRQMDMNEAKDRRFFKEVVDKSIRDAMSSHNEAFMDVFHNVLKEAIHGFLVGQGGSAYYNILDPSTQGTN